jgi:hypothetical protein
MNSLRSWLKSPTEPSTSRLYPLEYKLVTKKVMIDGIEVSKTVKVYQNVGETTVGQSTSNRGRRAGKSNAKANRSTKIRAKSNDESVGQGVTEGDV